MKLSTTASQPQSLAVLNGKSKREDFLKQEADLVISHREREKGSLALASANFTAPISKKNPTIAS